ncbi:aminotransferase class I/II-fold pyridoxal phosphate-dependent enzyme [Methylobacterium sp. J-077]|uniref:aminotransferase class I/II-fold pyridoxal phosphate-dependent enzyme n=1 Tax=Methylobacterium sp. J-077 TaxID=2836656 RepID=UPI001FB9FFC4|nr:aminotransferase class I/II-fold pyridoxal phosphate-dependent enzyme [Methylobacterium sp. J-077]MCJ2127177.1 aminotransferase class I/II-fold pyridoxal phosphate-dependent enzyme [Methylobacterium sp. J-077]
MSTTFIARRPASIRPSPSIAAKALVTQLRAQGRQIIDLTVGEPDFVTPRPIMEAAQAAMRAGDTHYTASNGTLSLRQAVADKLIRENGLSYTPDDIVVGCGAKQLIQIAFAATLDPGDEVIVPAPYWVSYPDLATLNDGVPVVVACPEEAGFKLSPGQLEAALTPRTKWLVLNSPNNPSGAVYTAAELAALGEVLARHPRVLVMTDEIYEHFVYDGQHQISFARAVPALLERTLTINGVSKAYAMTGWRIGYAAGPRLLARTMTGLLSQSTTCPSSISQAAAVAALSGDQTFVVEARTAYETRRDRTVALLDAIPGIACRRPAGAFYAYPNVAGLIGRRAPDGTRIESDLDVSQLLLRDGNVSVMDGTSYGLSPYLRVSFATSLDAIEAGCAAIARVVATLA